MRSQRRPLDGGGWPCGLVLGDGLPARLDYRLDGAVMLIHHTEVPARLEGRGIAATLTAAAFEHARREGLRIAPLCSYARAWARRHPEFADVLER
mgnify:CR=1 FL=1